MTWLQYVKNILTHAHAPDFLPSFDYSYTFFDAFTGAGYVVATQRVKYCNKFLSKNDQEKNMLLNVFNTKFKNKTMTERDRKYQTPKKYNQARYVCWKTYEGDLRGSISVEAYHKRVAQKGCKTAPQHEISVEHNLR